jgi:hypothetical protein
VIRRLLAGACVAIAASPGDAGAQAWTAQLVLSPMPSPFVSDWEVDPTVAELIVTNGTATATAVTFHYTLTRGGQVVLRGVTDGHTVGANESKSFNASTTFGGKADWNRELQDMVARTGRLPEGEYQGCVALADPGGAVLIERECATFTVGYPDPPFLVHPMNGDTVKSQAPMFEWQPVLLPGMADAHIGYVLQVAEVNPTTRQAPEVALASNILHYVEPGLVETSHQYPVGALPLVSGRTYAWRVQALDATGKPIASNQGRSEIWTFVYREPESEAQRTVARVELTASRDTLRFAGDTARYVALAYDADNVEIVGKAAEWRALDTTIARVDSSGHVTAAKPGETRIVATVDGVADSALSVTAASANLSVRFAVYDAATDKPDVLELIKSGSFDEVAPKLMEMLQSGELRIPLPRLPGVEAAIGGGSSGSGTQEEFDQTNGIEEGRARGGPSDASASATWPSRVRACNDVAFNVRDPYMDLNEKVFVFYIPLNRAQRQEVTNCLGVPNDEGEVTEAERLRGAIFIVSWKQAGLPKILLAVKGPGFGLTLHGPKVDVRYLVLNLSEATDVGAELLPANFAGYFGDVSFEAGFGLTFYSRRKCTEIVTPFCQFVSWINPENPFITIAAFAGVNASEVSGGYGADKGGGASVALGFTISASLPVRKWGTRIFGGSLDSTQVGFAFAAQDSLVEGAGAGDDQGHHRSMNLAPTVKVWFTGGNGNPWEVDGSVAFEIDPTNPDTVKLVIAAEVPARWKLAVARLGNPTIVFAKQLVKDGAVELGLSGTWGLGPWNGSLADAVGIDERDAGFEELGRGAVILKWQKPGPAPLGRAQGRVEERQSRWDHERRTAEANLKLKSQACLLAKLEAEQAEKTARSRPELTGSDGAAAAHRDAMCRQAELDKLRLADVEKQIAFEKSALEKADAAKPALPKPTGPPTCEGTLVFNGTRCFSWSARLSMATSSMLDLLALAPRLAGSGQ